MESIRLILSAFSLVLLWFLVLVRVDAQSRVQEVQALTSFKNAMDPAGDSDYAYWFNWNENDENACAWVGVTCTPNFTVEGLDFSGWQLNVGSFTALSKLPDLRQLDMSNNFNLPPGQTMLAGVIPDDIGSLTQLSRLDLSGNFLTGSIPPNISACRRLQFLSLERNNLTGTIPDLSELVHLQFLLLADNSLYGSFPIVLGKMSSLVTIDISRNQLNGSIASILNSTNLRNVWLDNNYLVGFDEPMYINAPNLDKFSVSGNQLDGIIPLALANLQNLLLLDMSINRLSGRIPAGFSNVTNLNFQLDLSQNQLSGPLPVDLLWFPNMSSASINISNNRLNGSIPTPRLTGAAYPVSLDLSRNQLTGPIPMGLSFFLLNLGNNLLSGDVVEVLAAGQGFGGAVLVSLGNNNLTGDLSRIAYQWANWSSLYMLDISNNNLSWRASESIPDPIGTALYNIPANLMKFIVRGNNFSGTSLPIAPIFHANRNLTNLQILDLSNNHLEGVISGAVFNSMWMASLQTLDLSHNLVIGPVPESIIMLPSLKILDLSYNKLSGPLPPIPIYSTLNNATFFLGNEGLCGYPLPLCPQIFTHHGTGVQWWILLLIIGGSVMIAVASCVMVTWRWNVYRKLHEQDADLIRTLMERELVTVMPLRNLKKATNNFAEGAQIGEGGFGTVYMGTLEDGMKVAIKRSKREGSEKDKEQFLNEVRILSQVNHRHLVKLIGCCMENKVALLVFEFISNGTLQDHLNGKTGDGHLSWRQRLHIAVQTADALTYLHSATTFPIYHRDVKSANILLHNDLSAKVADFGISKLAPMKATHVSTALQGTIGYMDPEYWVSFQLTEKSDVYSFGVVLLELISAKPAVDFQRGGEETSLVMFSGPYIQSGNLQPLIDPTIMGTYNGKNGHGKKSILDVGRLAMRCVDMQSNARPRMNEVWKELQDLCLKFDDTFTVENLGSLTNDDIENPSLNHEILLSQFALGNRSDAIKHYDCARSLELAHFSCPLKSRSRSMGM